MSNQLFICLFSLFLKAESKALFSHSETNHFKHENLVDEKLYYLPTKILFLLLFPICNLFILLLTNMQNVNKFDIRNYFINLNNTPSKKYLLWMRKRCPFPSIPSFNSFTNSQIILAVLCFLFQHINTLSLIWAQTFNIFIASLLL